MEQLLPYLIVGVVTGAIYAIAAGGLVVTYTTSGIFNFAHGAIGMVMAFLYWELRVNRGWPAPLALLLVLLVVAPLLGALIERVVTRGLEGATVAVSLVVTLGLLVFFLGIGQTFWKPGEGRQLAGFYGDAGNQVFGVFVTRHQQVTILAAIVVAALLYVVLNRTRIGVAMRAVVDDRNLLALNGGQPARVSMLAWAMGSSLAALAGILLAPLISLDHLQLTLLVVYAYAAAVVGRLKSLPLTFGGALALGLLQSIAVGYYGNLKDLLHIPDWMDSITNALPSVFLFVALLALPQARLRVGRLVGAKTPRVPELRESILGAVALVVGVWIVTAFMSGGDVAKVGQGLAYALIMLSLVVLVGYGAQVSLCQLTFAGLGAFAMAKLGDGGSPLGLLAALVLAAVVGAIVALPALRLQGLYLALATMAFAVLMDQMFFGSEYGFGTGGSLSVPRPELPGISFGSDRAYVVFLAFAFAAVAVGVLAVRRGQFGRLLAAMRDSPAACATLGLSLTSTKLKVFALSAGMAGLGGALFGGLRSTAGANDFLMFRSLPLLLLAVVGGITTVGGALIGGLSFAVFLPILQERIPSLSGVEFLFTGLAAVSVGRNPNGIAAQLSEKVGPLLPWRKAPPGGEEPARSSRRSQEEVVTVAAPVG